MSNPQKHPAGHPMAGFDLEFVDLPDYIIGITDRIWEQKQIETIRDYYSADCPVYALNGFTMGAEEVVQATYDTLKAFPDRELQADTVIWGGDATTGFHSSHRITSPMTNTGDSMFGPPTNKKVTIKVIAHCVCRNNQVIEEWLVRDNYSWVEQLGFESGEIARQWASQPAEPRYKQWREHEIARVRDGSTKTEFATSDDQACRQLVARLDEIWNQLSLTAVDELYAANAVFNGAAGRSHHGSAAIQSFYAEWQQAMPDLRISFDYVCAIESPDVAGAMDIAVRWTMVGTHDGQTRWGEPSGAPLLIIGEGHYRWQHGEVTEEWIVFDELSVLTQIERARAV